MPTDPDPFDIRLNVRVDRAPAALAALQRTAVEHGNVFEALLEAGKVCSLGQLSAALYRVGGQYRRNM